MSMDRGDGRVSSHAVGKESPSVRVPLQPVSTKIRSSPQPRKLSGTGIRIVPPKK
jgi:hypothetical protein